MSGKEIRAAGLRDPRTARAYAVCGAFLRRRNSAAYPMARLLLAPAGRPYWDAILAFSTYVDDLVDDPSRPVPERVARFDAYERDFFSLLAGSAPRPDRAATEQDAVGRQLAHAFAHFVRRWNIPEASVRQFMATIRTDLHVTEYPALPDLETYIHGVCGQGTLWGNALLVGDGVRNAEADAGAIAASFGLQLTDYLRDLREDLADGRLYLPLADLAGFGMNRADVEEAARRGRMDPALRELVRFEVDRARRYFDEAAGWWRLVEPSARELPRQYVRLGRLSLEQIAHSGHDVFRLAPRARLSCAISSWAGFTTGYARAAAGRLARPGNRRARRGPRRSPRTARAPGTRS